jgi:hypothetical protein
MFERIKMQLMKNMRRKKDRNQFVTNRPQPESHFVRVGAYQDPLGSKSGKGHLHRASRAVHDYVTDVRVALDEVHQLARVIL